jgi:hypothetical protein
MHHSNLALNLNALALGRSAAVIETLVWPPTGIDGIRVEDGTAGPRLLLRTADGRWVRLHSDRNPLAEAERWLDDTFGQELPNAIIVVGLGLGYVLDVLERRSARTRVIALEPDPRSLGAMFVRRDWTTWLRSGRLLVLAGPDFAGASDAAADLGESVPGLLVHPVAAREFHEASVRALSVAGRIVSGVRENAAARRRFAGPYLRNVLTNLPAIVSEGDVDSLAGLASGVPIVVVAAGPSLDANLADLRRLAGESVLICVNTALRSLLTAGLEPHLVVGVDAGPANVRHFDGLPSCERTFLAAEGSLDPRILRAFPQRSFTFQVSPHHPWPWLESLGVRRGTLRAWGSVLTTAFDLACRMGGNPIAFAGADLAFTDGLIYCRNTCYEPDWRHLTTNQARTEHWRGYIREQQPVEEADVRGGTVQTTAGYVQFRDWVVSRANEARDRRVINVTGGGILLGGRIEQREAATLGFPGHGGTADTARARIADAWRICLNSSEDARSRVRRALGPTEIGRLPLDAWVSFTGGLLDRDALLACVRESAAAFGVI